MSDTRTHTGASGAGPVLGSYRLLSELSTGGMGTVFRAQHVLLGRPAAVKLLRRDLTASPALVQRFVNEARAVTACKHPGIVEIYDFGYTPDGHAFIAMELLEGESLGRRLLRQRFTELEAAAIAHGIASALKAAHRGGVIHRDLKPDNVFLVPDPDGGVDRTKVLDFGIAKLADGAPAASRNTETGALIGTPLYMAPEQARAAAAIDHRADLYSLGCILYHMLVGRPPFVAQGAGEIIALQMFEAVVPPSRLAPVSSEMERVVLRLLEKDPANRFGSAGELVTALTRLDHRPTSRMTRQPDAALAGSAAGSTDSLALLDQTGALAPPRKRRTAALVTGALGLLALTAAGLGYALEHGDADDTAPLAGPTAPAPTAPPQRQTEPQRAPEPVRVPTTGQEAATPPPEPRPPRVVPGSHKPARVKTGPGVGAITPAADVHLPDPPPRVHRGARGVDSPKHGEYTPGGAPMAETVELDPKPRLPKDERSP